MKALAMDLLKEVAPSLLEDCRRESVAFLSFLAHQINPTESAHGSRWFRAKFWSHYTAHRDRLFRAASEMPLGELEKRMAFLTARIYALAGSPQQIAEFFAGQQVLVRRNRK